MKKRIVSALLALVLILSNFTGGGLIEHVHVEAADEFGETTKLYMYAGNGDGGFTANPTVIEISGYGPQTVKFNYETEKGLEWIFVKSTPNNGDLEATSIPAGTIIRTTSLKIDDIPRTFDGGKSSYDYAVPDDQKIGLHYYNWYEGQTHIDDMPSNFTTIEITFDVIDPTVLIETRTFEENQVDSAVTGEMIDITSQILSAAGVESLDLVESFSITIEASDTSKWSHSTQGDKAPSYEVLINGPAWSSTGTAVRQFISCESAKQVIDISKEEFDTAYTAAIAKGAVEKILINPYAFDPAKSPVTFKISVTAVAGESKIKPEPEDFAAPNNKLYLFVGQEDANSSVEITDYKDGYELSYTVPDGGVKDITTNSWLTIKSVSNVQGKESTTIPDTAAIDVTKVVITDEAGEVHTYESFVKDVLTGDLSALEPYRTVKGQDGLFVISIFDNFDWTDDEQHIVDMATKIKSVTVYFNVVDLTKVETVHPDGEVVLSLDGAGFPYNDNQPHTFEIKTLQKGQTAKIHFIGETNSDFRVWLSEGDYNRASEILVYPLSSLEGGKFDIVVDLTVENIESSIANSIQFKGNSTLSDFKLTHLGIVYPAVKEHPDWEDPEADSIAITAENCGNKAVTVEDGAFVTHANVKDKPEDENSIAQALIKLPKPVVSGQKISVHVVGTQPEGTVFRIWPSDGGDGNDASGQTSNEIRDVEFDYRFTYTFTGSKTNYLSIKGGIGQNVMEGVKITHIAVKYYDLQCNKNHDETWTVNDAPEKSEDQGTRFKIKLNEGDKIYNGDTVELHILGTADVEGKTSPGIRLYVASGEGYTSNNLTGSYDHVANITSGLFEFDAKFVIDAATGNPSNPEAVKYIGDSIVFNVDNDGYNSAEITHFAYKITHHEHTPLADSYKPVDDAQHSYECSICHQMITEVHTPGAEYGSDDTNHWNKCDKCGGKVGSTAVPHDDLKYTPNSDNKTHTVECKTCGYKNESEEHVESKNKYDEDDVGRYHVCEYCDARLDVTEHHYVFVDDKNGTTHHEECETCHHIKTDSTAEHEYENGACKDCNYAHPEEEHDWGNGWAPDVGGTTHTRTCSICGKEDTDPHNLPEEWTPSSEDETKHLKKCPDCSYEVTGEHNFGDSYEYVDAETHMQTCADCKKTVTSSHNYEEGKYSNSTTDHWQICKDCKGESDRENHKYVDGSDRCSVCNYWNHQHTMKWMDDGENHWEECTDPDCDYKTEKEPHVFDGSYDYNSTQHSQTCSVCHAKISEDHDLVDKYDNDFHWQECEVCDYETRATRHTLKTGSDENGHWEYCENCEYESDPVAHTPEKELGHDADSHWSICSECGEIYGKTAHTPSDELKHDAEGHWEVCSACGYENTDEKEAHIWDTGKVTVEPTETTEGVKTYTCTECGETKTETVPKSAHVHVAGKEWKHDEKTHWHECVSETCDDKTAKLDEAAHTEDEGTVTKAATETEEGVMTYKCTVCGAVTRTESIPKVTHTHVAGKEWKYDEKTHWHECVSETCDDKTAKLDEAEHVWDDGKVTVEPTYTKEGEKLYTCEVCGETKTETVPVKDHEHSTVTKSDEKGHWEECTICGEIIGEVEAHTPGEWITDSEATSTEAGKRHKECTVCGYVTDVLEVPAVGDIDVEVPTVGNVPKVELPAEQQEVLKNAIIDEEDVEAIESGASIDIELTVENAESTITPEDKAKSDEAAVQGNYTHVRYLDINLTKVVTDANGASTSEEISELGKEVRIVITVPLALAKPTGRDFAVIRVHDGEAAVLKDLDSDPNTVTISTNLFSSYTLVYVDTTPVPSTPGGLIGHVHVITGLQNDAHYHWRGCFICSMRVDYEPHRFVDGVCTVCHYRDPDYVPEVEEEEPAEAPDKEVTVVDAPAEGTEQGGDSEGTPEVTDTPADLPETEAEVVEVKEDDVTSENPETGVVFTGIGAVMAAIAALVAKRK